jgi:protein-tyrosine phosphatase
LDDDMGVHLSSVVAGISSLPALAAWTLRHALPLPAAIVLWHVAGSGFVVSLAASPPFAKRTTALLGKKGDGTIDPLNMALWWPYHAGLRAKLAIQRRITDEPAWHRITPELYIGAWPSEEALVPTAINPAVLDVTCELPLQVRPPAYLVLPVWDTHAPTSTQIDAGVNWALQQIEEGRSVLVHCAHGHGRSATLMSALLIAKGMAGDGIEAEALLKKERPRVRMNLRQKKALEEWLVKRQQQRKGE